MVMRPRFRRFQFPSSNARYLRVVVVPQVLLFLIVSLLGLAAGQSEPGVQTLIRSGQAALDSGNFARAVSDFQQAWQIAPENVEVNRGLLLSYLKQEI